MGTFPKHLSIAQAQKILGFFSHERTTLFSPRSDDSKILTNFIAIFSRQMIFCSWSYCISTKLGINYFSEGPHEKISTKKDSEIAKKWRIFFKFSILIKNHRANFYKTLHIQCTFCCLNFDRLIDQLIMLCFTPYW